MTRLRLRLATLGALAASLPAAPPSPAQTAADHAAQAHGKPIVGGHEVQPTPTVVEERWRHHLLMLKAREAAKANQTPIETARPDTRGPK